MRNPGLRALVSFLRQLEREAPANFSTICEGRERGYGMVSRYLRFCLKNDLIEIISERRTRGRYPSKDYALSEKGSKLLSVFRDTTL